MRIFEENRKNYKTTHKSKGCEFCDLKVIKDQEIQKLEGEYWRVLACKYPYMDGNLMIVPKRHVTHTDKLSKSEWDEFSRVLIASQNLLSELFQTKSFNIMLQLGPNSGSSIKHLHWMIIPRPKKQKVSGWNVFNDFYFVTLSYKDLIKKIDQYYKSR